MFGTTRVKFEHVDGSEKLNKYKRDYPVGSYLINTNGEKVKISTHWINRFKVVYISTISVDGHSFYFDESQLVTESSIRQKKLNDILSDGLQVRIRRFFSQ
jgi:hypothetical protein